MKTPRPLFVPALAALAFLAAGCDRDDDPAPLPTPTPAALNPALDVTPPPSTPMVSPTAAPDASVPPTAGSTPPAPGTTPGMP